MVRIARVSLVLAATTLWASVALGQVERVVVRVDGLV